MPFLRRLVGTLFVCLILTVSPTSAFAQDPQPAQPAPEPPFARVGRMYLGVAVIPNFTLDGITFDGNTGYIEEGGTEVAILPKLDSGNMFRIVAGFRTRPAALEISYERREHGASFQDEPVEAAFNAVNVDAKAYFRTHKRLQPHAVAGISFAWLDVKDGSATSLDPDALVGDASFSGVGLNLEGGVTIFATPRFGISAGYHYRFIWFLNYRGVGETEFKLIPRFQERTYGAIVTTFWTF